MPDVQQWTVRLTATAEQDYEDILTWTLHHFGERQVTIYDETLSDALCSLIAGPNTQGVKQRQEISTDIHTLHVARNGRTGRHFLMLRIHQNTQTVDVLRILHDQMDLIRHLDDGLH